MHSGSSTASCWLSVPYSSGNRVERTQPHRGGSGAMLLSVPYSSGNRVERRPCRLLASGSRHFQSPTLRGTEWNRFIAKNAKRRYTSFSPLLFGEPSGTGTRRTPRTAWYGLSVPYSSGNRVERTTLAAASCWHAPFSPLLFGEPSGTAQGRQASHSTAPLSVPYSSGNRVELGAAHQAHSHGTYFQSPTLRGTEWNPPPHPGGMAGTGHLSVPYSSGNRVER